MKTFEVLIRAEAGCTSTATVHADAYAVESRYEVPGYLLFYKAVETLPVAMFAPGWLSVTRKK